MQYTVVEDKKVKRDVVGVCVIRRCNKCGTKLYEKLGTCNGFIAIKCPKCGQVSNLNLALRRVAS